MFIQKLFSDSLAHGVCTTRRAQPNKINNVLESAGQ
jgi:hypothetical protein